MTLKSTAPLRKTISGKFDKRYTTLRYTSPRPIPTNDQLDLTKEEDFLHPEEPKPQDYLTTKVFRLIIQYKLTFHNQYTTAIVFQAVDALNQLVRMIGSSPLDDKILTDPSVAAAIHTFSSLSFESLKNVYGTVQETEQLK